MWFRWSSGIHPLSQHNQEAEQINKIWINVLWHGFKEIIRAFGWHTSGWLWCNSSIKGPFPHVPLMFFFKPVYLYVHHKPPSHLGSRKCLEGRKALVLVSPSSSSSSSSPSSSSAAEMWSSLCFESPSVSESLFTWLYAEQRSGDGGGGE